MIKSFNSKALQAIWEEGHSASLPAYQQKKIRRILQAIDIAEELPKDLLTVPGWRLHLLKGNWQDYWSLRVDGNYRIIFRFRESQAYDVNYIDYH